MVSPCDIPAAAAAVADGVDSVASSACVDMKLSAPPSVFFWCVCESEKKRQREKTGRERERGGCECVWGGGCNRERRRKRGK